jgi:hypothetical protein
MPERTQRKRLGELLVEAGVIDDDQLRAALGHQRQWGGKLGRALVDLHLATEPQIVAALSRKLGFEVVQLDGLQRTPALDAAMKLVPREVARRNNVLPLAADLNSVTVAMSDPTNLAVTDELSFRTGRRVKISIAGDREVARAIERLFYPEEVRGARALDMPAQSSRPLNAAHEALPGHMQQHFFRSMRDLGAEAPPRPPGAAAVRSGEGETAPAGEPSTAAREAAFRDTLDRLVAGEDVPGLKPTRLVAALTRVLLRRGHVTEAEILAELTGRLDDE